MSRRTRRLLAEAAGIMELSVTEMEMLEEEQLYIYFLLLNINLTWLYQEEKLCQITTCILTAWLQHKLHVLYFHV